MSGAAGRLRLVYVPAGAMEPSQVLDIYTRFKAQGLLKWITWYEEALPEPERGSARAFMRLCDQSDMVVMGNDSQFIGVAWFCRHTPERAHMSFCYCRKLARDLLVECTREAAKLAHSHRGVTELWGETPWPWVVRHCERGGATLVATLPAFVQAMGKRHPLYVMRIYMDDLLKEKADE